MMNITHEMLCYSKDKQGIYLNVNPGFVASADISSADDALGRNDKALPWAEFSTICMGNDKRVMVTEKTHIFIEHSVLNGKPVIYRSFKSPLIGKAGKVIGTTGLSIRIHANSLVPITQQQTECLKYLARGFTQKQIARELGLSQKTVEHYLEAVKLRLDCKSRSDLIMQAIERGLVNIY